jgi:hypothetical protein
MIRKQVSKTRQPRQWASAQTSSKQPVTKAAERKRSIKDGYDDRQGGEAGLMASSAALA